MDVQVDTVKQESDEVQVSIKTSILDRFRQINDEIAQEKEQESPKRNHKKKFNKFNNDKKRQHQHDTGEIHVGLKEIDVGITEYISDLKGFSGIIKHRISDFQVHEIDKKGNPVELTSFEIPKIAESEICENTHKFTDEQMFELLKLMGQSTGETCTYEIDVTGKTKQERGDCHKAIKKLFQNELYSNTKTVKNGDEEKTYLIIGKCSNKNTERRSWPKGTGYFLHFTIYKENMDTTSLINKLSQKLSVRPNSITYAGIKDKRGKTSQRMCVKMRRAEDLLKIKKDFSQVAFGNFSYEFSNMRLGDTSGNKFTLVIRIGRISTAEWDQPTTSRQMFEMEHQNRNINVTDDELIKGLEHLKQYGFINYFGLQRFGTSIVAPTYAIGKQLLLGDWEEAVNLLLKPRFKERSSYSLRNCRDVWAKTKIAAAALKCLHAKDTSIEAQILKALKTQGNNQYFNALFSIPRNSMLLYLHSYQSLVWNKIVSKRIKTFGYKVLPGDLVLMTNDEPYEPDVDEKLDDDDEQSDHVKPEVKKHVRARLLTKEEAEKTNLDQIVYPLPGNDILYPGNEIAEWYKEILAEDGITLEHFENSNKSFALYGTYRTPVQVPMDLTYEIVNYSDHNEDFILSDMDKMENVTLNRSNDGEFKAVILDFTLKPSTYATMFMRELMKCDTAVTDHAIWSKKIANKDKETSEPSEKKVKTENL